MRLYQKILAAGALIATVGLSVCTTLEGRVEQEYVSLEKKDKFLGGYYTFSGFETEIKKLAEEYPKIVSIKEIGKSIWHRPIYVIKISDKNHVNDGKMNSLSLFEKIWYTLKKPKEKELREPQVLITGGLHSGELIGMMVPTKIARYIAENYRTNKRIEKLVNEREIYFVPVINPDGLALLTKEFDFIADKELFEEKTGIEPVSFTDYVVTFWRKNCHDNNSDGFISICGYHCSDCESGWGNEGVDLNRNFSIDWGGGGCSHDIASQVYCGPYDEKDDDNDWNPEIDDLNNNGKPDIWIEKMETRLYANKPRVFIRREYSPEPHINEDPVDGIDNDGDGLIDEDPAGGFSEPETKALKRFVEGLDNLITAVDFHSFGNLLLYPPGFTEKPTEDEELFKKIATEMRNRQPHEKYTVQSLWDLYQVSGDLGDWLYFKHGVMAFAVELYDGGGYCALADSQKAYNPLPDKIDYHTENLLEPVLYLIEISDNPRKVLGTE